ncbi:hypothetical protein ABIE44_000179 [Marmoricola sp. OAE513]|uniref:DUF4235 domain-containing protein n=1 Tax=Marmoricola sp. OAE513 TaxID=2817894 RepID=UPI001AE60179
MSKNAETNGEQDSSKIWGAFSLVAALLAASVARKGLTATWKAAAGKEPPANPADPEVSLNEALLWAGLSGLLVGIARMLATRRAADYYARSVGKLPPGSQS